MIEQLVQYAKKNIADSEAGFAAKDVKWGIMLTKEGLFSAVIDLNPGSKSGKRYLKAPELDANILRAGGYCHYLVETTEVVTLLGVEEEKKNQNEEEKAKDKEKKKKKHQYFVDLINSSANEMDIIKPIKRFYESSTFSDVNDDLKTKKAKGTEKISFIIDGTEILNDPTWHEWWRKFRFNLVSRTGDKNDVSYGIRCMISGKTGKPALTHPGIKGMGVIGGNASCVLVGFDKDSFCSYGFSQSENAAVVEEIAFSYSSALNQLIREGKKLSNVLAVYWFKDKIQAQDDILGFLIGNEENEKLEAEEKVKKLIEGIMNGERIDLKANRYYSALISVTGARIMVREWMEDDFLSLAKNITAWFEDMSIIDRSGLKKANGAKFMAVLGSMVRDLKDIPSPLASKIWRCAVMNETIPLMAISNAVLRFKAEVIDPEKVFNHARMGLIKAYYLRKLRLERGVNMSRDYMVSLEENHPSNAYQAGRLMAVLAEVQRSALGDVGAGVIQRFYASASTTPALVLGRLTKQSQYHLSKLSRGLSFWYEGIISEIWSKFHQNIPSTLTLEEQSLFALGYYQQIANMRASKKQSINNDNNEGGMSCESAN